MKCKKRFDDSICQRLQFFERQIFRVGAYEIHSVNHWALLKVHGYPLIEYRFTAWVIHFGESIQLIATGLGHN